MFHLIATGRKIGGRLLYFSCIFIAGILLISAPASGSDQPDKAKRNVISRISAQPLGKNLVLKIKGSAEPTYTIYELFKPSRIVVDVANAQVDNPEKLALPADIDIALTTKNIQEVTPDLTRFEFTLPQSYSFNTSQKENDIVIIVEDFITDTSPADQADEAASVSDKPGPSEGVAVSSSQSSQTIESQLPEVDPLQASESGPAGESAAAMQDTFNFSGYNKERITVDFYKIDLHNVFRMLREVSGANIVVDESVSGSLTLALDDVPWDFALDIILNLKNLKKIERFNTIVIHPAGKTFDWPERTEDNISFEADIEITEQEALIIQQQQSLPPEVVEAKKIIAEGRKSEKRGDAETAVKLYERALQKWPDNSRLANKIAALYLVQLRQNTKAAYFADKALAADSSNGKAALNAAIAHANMKENKLAQQFFDQSVNVGKPSKEALLSYAVFSEQQEKFDAAMTLLYKHDELYGQNLNSMVAEARILDKQGYHEDATEAYRAILLAGFRVPPDLKQYITARMSLSQSM